MNNDIFYAIPTGVCILLAMYFFINWCVTYSTVMSIDIFSIGKEGMNGLSYISKENPDFSEDEAIKLNRYRRLTYVFMVLGIAIITLNMVLG